MAGGVFGNEVLRAVLADPELVTLSRDSSAGRVVRSSAGSSMLHVQINEERSTGRGYILMDEE